MLPFDYERVMPIAVLLLGVVLAALYGIGALDESIAGVLFAVLVIGCACAYAVRAMVEAAATRGATALALLLGAAAFAAAIAPAVWTLVPGTPAAHGELAHAGDSFALPASARGSIRLLIHGKLPGSDATSTDLAFDVGQAHVNGQLSRTRARARLGRRGSTTVIREHDADYIEVEAARGADRVTLARVHGELRGPLRVDVFSDPLPLRAEAVLGAVLLVLAALFAVSTGAGSSSLSALTWALLFGALVHHMATPDAAVGPEFGALLASGFSAVVIGHLLLAVAQSAVAAARRAAT